MSDPSVAELLAQAARGPASPLRRQLASGVRRALGASASELAEYGAPAGDVGLFGPDSVVWRVHADLPAMLIGGLSALMYQTLHPLAMAGVAAHSSFREDPYGRLQRTARFVAGTTFGATPFAERLLAQVREVHERVRGVAPDGRRYSASDPALLTFVHTTEVWSFLSSYQRYAPRPLARVERDRYLAEVALIGEGLGASGVPHDVAATRRYFAEREAELALTPAAAETVRFLRRPVAQSPLELIGHEVLLAAAIDLLPGDVRRRLGFSTARTLSGPGVFLAAEALSRSMRWAVGPSAVAAIARARIAAVPSPGQRSVLWSANPDRRRGERTTDGA